MPYQGPRSAIESVLTKIGVDPQSRLSPLDQDPEYTACIPAELPQYLDLYESGQAIAAELDVLACFILESLNDLIQSAHSSPDMERSFSLLFSHADRHAAELSYWMDTSDPDPENWWPLTHALLRWRRDRGAAR